MQIRKVAAGSVLAAGLGVAGMLGAGAASADSSAGNGGEAIGSNPSISDTQGFGNVNHMKGDGVNGYSPENGYNAGHTGLGDWRNKASGTDVSAQSGKDRVYDADHNVVDYQVNTTGNKFSPGQTKKLP